LWALDQPPGTLDLRLMLRDTTIALEQLPEACSRFRKNLPPTCSSHPRHAGNWGTQPPSPRRGVHNGPRT
jgi:hypothetical protein